VPPVTLDAPWYGQEFNPPLRLDIEYVQAVIVQRLKDSGELYAPLTQVEIAGFPDKPEVYRLTHPVGAVLVFYAGSTYTAHPTTIDEVRQEREMKWTLSIVARDLGWAYGGPPSGPSPGAYGIVEVCRYALAGFQITGFTKMVPRDDRFVRRDAEGGVWYYELDLCHRSTVVNVSPDENFPLLSDVRYVRESVGDILKSPPQVFQFDNTGAIQLPRPHVLDVVVTSTDGVTTYVAGTDYDVADPDTGLILIHSGGALSSLDFVRIAFDFTEAEVPSSL